MWLLAGRYAWGHHNSGISSGKYKSLAVQKTIYVVNLTFLSCKSGCSILLSGLVKNMYAANFMHATNSDN